MSPNGADLIACPQCGVKNRVQPAQPGQRAKCGKCGAALPEPKPAARPAVITDANFQAEVKASPLPVLLDCWAPWCGPCRQVGPIVDGLARKWQGRAKVGKLNVDENPQTAAAFQIRSIPTLLIFHAGRLVDTLVGALPREEIVKRMAPYLK